jgi:hypothetical protein
MKKNIRLSERISGIPIMALGVGLVAIDYFIVKAMMSVGLWGAIHSLVAKNNGIELVATIKYPKGLHPGYNSNDTLGERQEKETQYTQRLAAHNAEHDEIRRLHLNVAELTQNTEDK